MGAAGFLILKFVLHIFPENIIELSTALAAKPPF